MDVAGANPKTRQLQVMQPSKTSVKPPKTWEPGVRAQTLLALPDGEEIAQMHPHPPFTGTACISEASKRCLQQTSSHLRPSFSSILVRVAGGKGTCPRYRAVDNQQSGSPSSWLRISCTFWWRGCSFPREEWAFHLSPWPLVNHQVCLTPSGQEPGRARSD